MNKAMVVLVVLVVALVGWWWFSSDTIEIEQPEVEVPLEMSGDQDDEEADMWADEYAGLDDPDHTFIMEATGREFIVDGVSNPELTVAVGDRVRVELTITGGTHDFVIDELGVASAVMSAGQTEVIEFVANEIGTFEYYCSVGNHYAEGMFGIFNVIE